MKQAQKAMTGQKPLAGKVALVTGSTSGIGLGVARKLAEAGSTIIMNGFGDPKDIEREQTAIAHDFGVEVVYMDADMSDPHAISQMITTILGTHHALDILVNNAGVQHVSPIEEFPIKKWDQIIAINLSSAFHTVRAALPMMRSKNFGRIINVASAHGLVASPFKSAYVAAKHGILGLTKTVALETAETGITCNAICPGYVHTPLVEAQIEGQARAHGISRDSVVRDVLLKQQPNKRFATVEEIGALAVFLASEAGNSITGTSIPVDGGWTAQ